jgi:small-conductance mechanosensitive channel
VTAENGTKLLITLTFVVVILLAARIARRLVAWAIAGRNVRVEFWTRQAIALAAAIILVVGVVSIWFDDPARLTTALGLVTAGLAFALQKLVSAVAGYFVILRGKTFTVGDRIRMGGVRGDVIALRFTQTTIMEMGQPPAAQSDEPAMWVKSRQYTGRVVTVSNAAIFDQPVYNYTRDFPYIWEELTVPIPYDADRARAERILLDAAMRRTVEIGKLSEAALREMERRYFTRPANLEPRVYWRLTDNWLELTVRFLVPEHGIREIKDAMARKTLPAFEAAKLEIASTSIEIVGIPPVRLTGAPHREEQTP